MIRWRLRKRLDAKGWTNAHLLAAGAGIGYPAATRIFAHLKSGKKLTRFDFTTLETIAKKLGVKNPLALLEHVADK